MSRCPGPFAAAKQPSTGQSRGGLDPRPLISGQRGNRWNRLQIATVPGQESVKLYGFNLTLAKVRGQYHMRKRYARLSGAIGTTIMVTREPSLASYEMVRGRGDRRASVQYVWETGEMLPRHEYGIK